MLLKFVFENNGICLMGCQEGVKQFSVNEIPYDNTYDTLMVTNMKSKKKKKKSSSI